MKSAPLAWIVVTTLLSGSVLAQGDWKPFRFAGGFTVNLPGKVEEIRTIPGMADMKNSKAWLCSGDPVSYYLSVGDLDRKAPAAARFVFPVLVATVVKDLKLLRSEREYLVDGWPCLAFSYDDGPNLQEVRVCLLGRKMVLMGATLGSPTARESDADRYFDSIRRPESLGDGPIAELQVPWTGQRAKGLGFTADFPSDYVAFERPYGRPHTLTAQYLSGVYQLSYAQLSPEQLKESRKDLTAARSAIVKGTLDQLGNPDATIQEGSLAGEPATFWECVTANGLGARGAVLFHGDLMVAFLVRAPKIHIDGPVVDEFFARLKFDPPRK